MGSYSTLRIGSIQFSWKYYVPTFLAFLFSEEDFYAIPEEPDEEEWFEEIGFRSNCGDVLEALDRYGYTVDFFAEVYDVFYDRLDAYFMGALADDLFEEGADPEEVPKTVAAHLEQWPAQSRAQELRTFVDFLRKAIAQKFSGPGFSEPVPLGFGPQRRLAPAQEYIRSFRRPEDILADFESLQMYFLGQARRFPPAVVRVATLFDEDYAFAYPEVISLMYTRLVLEAAPPQDEIVLDLADISAAEGRNTIEEVKELQSSLGALLADKINLYNRVFKVLSDNEQDIRDRYAKSRGRSLLIDVKNATSNDEKGRTLEELMAVLFEGDPGFEVVERRFSTGDEEIDLLIKNNVNRPFWTALGSPLLFVECKNWSGRVGSREARDFEVKLQNHRPLVKLGVFVAFGGVTSEFVTEVKRASRADYALAVIESEDIASFLDGGSGIVDWLEERISRPV